MKFAEKTRHQVFIEPEGRGTNEVYVDGMSSSMPDDVQQRMYRTVPGLENCVIVKNAYAIEYDCINANLLKLTLETRDVDGLFCAGQFNGSSWRPGMWTVCSVPVSLTEAAAMKKQLHRDLWQVSTRL